MSRHLVSEPARPGRCPHCGARLLVGHVDGVPTRVDVAPITSVTSEVAARMNGRRTYDRMRDNELVYRDEYRITNRELPVHAQHQCATNSRSTDE